MQLDFHYYATYCAAILAGYSHLESVDISYSSQFVDCCTKTFLKKIGGPQSAATTQSQAELINARTDLLGLQDITRIWSSFHFLPRDLKAQCRGGLRYKNKYRLICGPNGDLLTETVILAKDQSLQAIGLVMHILADTWAHTYFAGTPSLVINNTNAFFYEVIKEEGQPIDRLVTFKHNPGMEDDLEQSIYVNSVYQAYENTVMNLGHGRAGHLPDYSFITYKYLPAWGDYGELCKENPSDYFKAFCQMVYTLRYFRAEYHTFERNRYDYDIVSPIEEKIHDILEKRQLDASLDWKRLGESLSGHTIPDFDQRSYESEYLQAENSLKDETFLGRFFMAALKQKSMVTNRIFLSGNILAGFSVDLKKEGFRGIKDFARLIKTSL